MNEELILEEEVALRKESVDRNYYSDKDADWVRVALRKESVDRNSRGMNIILFITVSLSARRAWIEILIFARQVCLICVALRKESVDRNITRGQLPTPEPPSLSARRAWIEITSDVSERESLAGRSPQGERG